VPLDLAAFHVYTRTNHNRKTVNVLFSDGHAATLDNSKADYTVQPLTNLYDSFRLILDAFERADLK
jgi:prepilin-type processing-associated H-X9-DG protein